MENHEASQKRGVREEYSKETRLLEFVIGLSDQRMVRICTLELLEHSAILSFESVKCSSSIRSYPGKDGSKQTKVLSVFELK